ncbi:MAG: septum formation initiator family protein [Treponema sp.]|nr:septum formation initiator family protein [Treponema sp.]
MEKMRFLLAACAGTLIYVIVSLLGGKDGVFAGKQLEEQKHIIALHTAEIQKINDELTLENLALQKDKDVVAAYAHQLDYIADGEKLIKINGLTHKNIALGNTAGTIMLRKEIFYLPEWVCKLCGVTVFVLVLLILILTDVAKEPAGAKRQARSFITNLKRSGTSGVKSVPVGSVSCSASASSPVTSTSSSSVLSKSIVSSKTSSSISSKRKALPKQRTTMSGLPVYDMQ